MSDPELPREPAGPDPVAVDPADVDPADVDPAEVDPAAPDPAGPAVAELGAADLGAAGPRADAADVVIDARGTRCPMPVIMAARAAVRLSPGRVLRVLATDPAAAADLPAWARMRGHRVDELEQEGDLITCRVRLGG